MATLTTRSAWADVRLTPDEERVAAQETLHFLEEVAQEASKVRETGDDEIARKFHRVWDFSTFSSSTIPFLVASLGAGEVRIVLHGGLVKMEETTVPALWRMQLGETQSFVLALVPPSVVAMASRCEPELNIPAETPEGVFAGPAILEELREALQNTDTSTYSDKPGHMVELTRQPLAPGDQAYLAGVLGLGEIDIRLSGFADSRIMSTKVRGIWHTQILNHAGKGLLDAYVVGLIPAEVPATPEELEETVTRCREIADVIEADRERGVLG